ncbi:hypothetical protein E8E13_001217 [Curvularia kusanoi]|uniref:Uncharacterized protein n=1 Tax=Curvularia kusanoi TaxID=90978 RepID=A0A9P4TCS0_CURKU|nr:hypothetical protein E8E13_001217 [Curvularia kusanoi]
MSSDQTRIAELEAQLSQAHGALAEKNTTLKNAKKRLAASLKQVHNKDGEIKALKERNTWLEGAEKCHQDAHDSIATFNKNVDKLTIQLVTTLRIQNHLTMSGLTSLASIVAKLRKHSAVSASPVLRDSLGDAAEMLVEMASHDQLEELDRKMFWWCKGVFELHGYAAAHHAMNEVEDGGCLCHEGGIDLKDLKAKIKKRMKMYEAAREKLEVLVGDGLLERRVISKKKYAEIQENIAAFVEAHLALKEKDNKGGYYGFHEDGCVKQVDVDIEWEDWRFPWPGCFVENMVQDILEGENEDEDESD